MKVNEKKVLVGEFFLSTSSVGLFSPLFFKGNDITEDDDDDDDIKTWKCFNYGK